MKITNYLFIFLLVCIRIKDKCGLLSVKEWEDDIKPDFAEYD